MRTANTRDPMRRTQATAGGAFRRGQAAVRGGLAPRRRAFTLMELLVVIGIMGILASIAVPSIRSMMASNTISSGSRQILDDLAYARRLAISGRRVVYVVFATPGGVTPRQFANIRQATTLSADQIRRQLQQLTNLVNGQFTAYALFARHVVGDQPGQQTWRYLTDWKQLPEGMFFTTNKFIDLGSDKAWLAVANVQPDTNRPLPYALFPFPATTSPTARVPYIAFDSSGRAFYENGLTPLRPGESVSLSRGSIFYTRDNLGRYTVGSPPDIVATATNKLLVRINWLTGRAAMQQ
ncbi:MAG: prepilin-type N-terminal cleavage/methylation domain-containing protein [Verrucomicrobiota bacterium]